MFGGIGAIIRAGSFSHHFQLLSNLFVTPPSTPPCQPSTTATLGHISVCEEAEFTLSQPIVPQLKYKLLPRL